MVDWNSPEEIQLDATAFVKVVFAFCGVYFWEWATSLNFDISFITGKRNFRLPMIFYFLNRYLLFATCIGLCVAQGVTSKIDCQSLYTFMQLAGNMSGGLASVNFAIRTIAVWNQNKWIVASLVAIIMGHWSIILQGALLHADWVPSQGCVIIKANNRVLAAQFVYTMCFDLIVLLLTAYKLALHGGGRSRLVNILFRDGLIYFIVAFLGNILVTVFQLASFNAVMTIIFDFPVICLSTIASTRAVRNLLRYVQPGAEIFSTTKKAPSSALGFHRSLTGPSINVAQTTKGDIHCLEMNTLNRADQGEDITPCYPSTKAEEGSDFSGREDGMQMV